ncbi:XdhC family protein [Cronobacter sakazakii]|uniref:XdhC family protein n=1 Tax=Cronobacter sakazakii TaxID=28141 RepID=UPI00025F6517|nr:XdhC family protein [Cronobacter sakazakii]AFJ97690.1 putative xanthine dehydrogenase accessory factor [Cronobacter sakazakii ES15]ELY2476456.1 XdhC family protein [Cronobacter sakazakii]ELY2733669.1 XdhC family protein [Cronobacter sakazakii]ELY5837578.1 XdhC family protein [Cronobacter sakazakii]ELY6208452.1 XdhC family protein [Cronobacter sakazakii]
MLQQPLLTEQARPEAAFLTDDSTAILRFAAQALRAGMAAALVTLVEIRGGSSRALGAQMAVRDDGAYCGFVSGGCVEAAAAFEALEAIACGKDRMVKYGEGSPYFDIVLPCGGGITLAIHPLREATPLLAVLNALSQRKAAGLRYHPSTQTLQNVLPVQKTGWRDDVFDVRYTPCTQVIIFGRSVEAEATATIARAAGYDVLVNDGVNPQTACAQIDADTAVIVLFHDLDRELPVLESALSDAPFYIGALGSQRTHAARTAALRERGFSEQDIARIKAPIGIFPKARDAQSLALSILADVAAARLNREAAG